MKQAKLIPNISDLFVQFSNEVKVKGKLKLTDINIIAEDILVPILSLAYNTDLINLNTIKNNFPGIDLATNEHITFGNTNKILEDQIIYKKKSLLSLEIWESNGKVGYGFSNLINSIDLTAYKTLIKEGLPNNANKLLNLLLNNFNSAFAQNYENEKSKK